MLAVIWVFQSWSFCNRNIKDDCSQVTMTENNNNEKVWSIAGVTKMRHRDRKWANAVGKMVPINLLGAGLPQTFNLWKTHHLRRAITRSSNTRSTWPSPPPKHLPRAGLPRLVVSAVSAMMRVCFWKKKGRIQSLCDLTAHWTSPRNLGGPPSRVDTKIVSISEIGKQAQRAEAWPRRQGRRRREAGREAPSSDALSTDLTRINKAAFESEQKTFQV